LAIEGGREWFPCQTAGYFNEGDLDQRSGMDCYERDAGLTPMEARVQCSAVNLG